MKKKIVVLLSLVLVMCTLLCACGEKQVTVNVLNEETQEYEELSVSVVGKWKGVQNGNVFTFEKNGMCTYGEGEYKYEVEDNKISIYTLGFLMIETDNKYVILASDSGNVYVRENEYEEYSEYFAGKQIE